MVVCETTTIRNLCAVVSVALCITFLSGLDAAEAAPTLTKDNDVKSLESDTLMTSELRCSACKATVELLLSKAGPVKRRSEESVAILLDDPKKICDLEYFEKGSATIDNTNSDITHQKFKYAPPEMQRGCEDILGDCEEAITDALLGQRKGERHEDIVRKVCFEETNSCASEGGVKAVPPKKQGDAKKRKGKDQAQAKQEEEKGRGRRASKADSPDGDKGKEQGKRKKRLTSREQETLNQRLLSASAQREDVAEIKRVLKHGAEINVVVDHRGGRTALMAACLAGHSQAVEVLLDNGADYTIGEQDGYTCLHGAGFQGRDKVAEVAISKGLPVDDRHQDGFTPLHRATWGSTKKHADTIRVMVKGGADVNARATSNDGKHGMTPIMMALSAPRINFHVVKALLKNGANANEPSPQGKTPLGMLITGGSGEKERIWAVKILVKHGADLDAIDKHAGIPVRELADSFGYTDVINNAVKEMRGKDKGEL